MFMTPEEVKAHTDPARGDLHSRADVAALARGDIANYIRKETPAELYDRKSREAQLSGLDKQVSTGVEEPVHISATNSTAQGGWGPGVTGRLQTMDGLHRTSVAQGLMPIHWYSAHLDSQHDWYIKHDADYQKMMQNNPDSALNGRSYLPLRKS
jgi:hypothetical protein